MRPKTKDHRDLPPRMLRRSRTLKNGKVWESFYYNGRDAEGKRKEIPLGNDLNEAKRKWAELECKAAPPETGLMRFIFDRYERDIVPTKKPATQKDNLGCLKFLRLVFDGAPIESITPQHIARYRDERSKVARVRANREIAMFSHVWNTAREWGYTAKENPTRGVRKNKETPRDYYADDVIWAAVYTQACDELKDAMDLAYLTGQRPADVLKMRLHDVKDDMLAVTPAKVEGSSGKKLRIQLTVNGVRSELGQLIDRIKQRPRKVASVFLIATRTGTALNRWTLRTRFDDARAAAAKAATEAENLDLAEQIKGFQFRDIRPKAASELPLAHASRLLGHTEQEITEKVYRRVGEVVQPTR